MRQLTAKQKRMLDAWYNEQKAKGKNFGLWWDVKDDDDFDGDLYQQIDSVNPCEIFHQNVNSYIQDKAMAELD